MAYIYFIATVVHIRVTLSHLRIRLGHLRVTIGHLRVTVGFFSISKHKTKKRENSISTSYTAGANVIIIIPHWEDSRLEDDGPMWGGLPRGHHHIALLRLLLELSPAQFQVQFDTCRYLVF